MSIPPFFHPRWRLAVLVGGLLLLAGLPHSAHTQTAAPGQPDAVVMQMDAVLRLRSAPSTEAAILDLLTSATPLDIIGRTADSYWLAVRTPDGKAGWVWRDYLIVAIDLTPVCVVDERAILAACADLDADVTITALETFQRGAALGNQPNVFAKVGDSITVSSYFMRPIGQGRYDLATYTALQPVIDWYATGRIGADTPFSRQSVAAGVGWAAASVLDPDNADPDQCAVGETPLACEYRITRPAVALIMFGTNDVGYVGENAYRANLERILAITLERGIIPVISTIPPREGYEEQVQRFNAIIATVARDNRVPLWDYYTAMINLPDAGLTSDGVHPSEGPFGAEGAAVFTADNLYYGYVIRNLTGLQMLDALWSVTGS